MQLLAGVVPAGWHLCLQITFAVLLLCFGGFQAFLFFRFRGKVDKIQGPRTFPGLGNLWPLRELLFGIPLWYHKPSVRDGFEPVSNTITWVNHFKGVFRIWLGPAMPLLIVSSADQVKEVCGIHGASRKAALYKLIHPWLGTGLLTSGGSKWKERRRLITPTFHFECLQSYFGTFQRESQMLVSKLDSLASEGKPFHIYPIITSATLDIIMECAFGQSLGAQTDATLPYPRAVGNLLILIFDRILKPWQWLDPLFWLQPAGIKTRRCLKTLHSHTEAVIASRMAALARGETPDVTLPASGRAGPRLSFLDMLLATRDESGRPLTPSDIREEVDTFMFEGHDTTSAGLTWSLYIIGSYSEVQIKMQQELDKVLGGKPITTDKISELTYTTAVIKECLRLFPPVPFFARHTERDVCIGPYDIPAGVDVMVSPQVIHHSTNNWEDPWAFDPERFLLKDKSARAGYGNPWAYIPFSAGPRNCIGQQFALMEMTVVISTILQTLTIHTPEDQEIFMDLKLISRPKNGALLISVTKRH